MNEMRPSVNEEQESPLSVAILGAGRLAWAVGRMLSSPQIEMRFWARKKPAREKLQQAFPAAKVPDNIDDAIRDVSLVFYAVPSTSMTELVRKSAPSLSGDQIVLHACRGVAEEEGLHFAHDVFRRETCIRKIGVLGGPLYIEEMGAGHPLVALVGSRYDEVYRRIRDSIQNPLIKLHGTRDLVGVQVAGAISNVTAIAVGMCDALELGDTARGVLCTQGLSNAMRLGVRLGAERATFSGLAGVGDLIPRKVQSTRRNQEVGRMLVQGLELEAALMKAGGSVEGVTTAIALGQNAMGKGLSLVEMVAGVIHKKEDARAGLERILSMDISLDNDVRPSVY